MCKKNQRSEVSTVQSNSTTAKGWWLTIHSVVASVLTAVQLYQIVVRLKQRHFTNKVITYADDVDCGDKNGEGKIFVGWAWVQNYGDRVRMAEYIREEDGDEK